MMFERHKHAWRRSHVCHVYDINSIQDITLLIEVCDCGCTRKSEWLGLLEMEQFDMAEQLGTLMLNREAI